MVWEILFMLLILKIPVVYLCMVVWYAIREEPQPEEPANVAAVVDTPGPDAGPRWRPGRVARRLRPPGPTRRPKSGPRVATPTRAEARHQ